MDFYEHAGLTALGSRLRRLADKLTRDAESIYRLYEIDIDPRWFPVFYMLSLKDEAAITELAKDIGQSHPAVSQVVREMSKSGIVTTSKSEQDSRVNLVALSDKGKELASKMEPQCEDVGVAVTELLATAGVDFWANINAIENELEHASLLARVRAVRKNRKSSSVEIVPFSQTHEAAFKELNLAWIQTHWEPEPDDFKALDHPQEHIIEKGGYIAIAVRNNLVVGTCALMKIDETTYELAKMAVSDSAKGEGIGMMLGNAIVKKARQFGATRLYLESNTILKPAINLYRKLGFKRVSGQPSPYDRCNIQMELLLDE